MGGGPFPVGGGGLHRAIWYHGADFTDELTHSRNPTVVKSERSLGPQQKGTGYAGVGSVLGRGTVEGGTRKEVWGILREK